jgi:dUTP pyrophosphatase
VKKFLVLQFFKNSIEMQVVLLSEHARIPVRATPGAAGYDICAAEAAIVPAGGKASISTDLQIAIPQNCVGKICGRSGLAWKNDIEVFNGSVDSDFRLPMKVLLFNRGSADFKIEVGDRCAQLICQRIEVPEITIVSSLDETERTGGFGSTGIQPLKKQKLDTENDPSVKEI